MMRNGHEYEKLGIRLPYGLMLYGAPGVGKTLMANCLIKASGRKVAGFGLTGYGYHNSEELNHHQEIANSALLNQYYIKAKEILAKNAEFMAAVIDKLESDSLITMDDIKYLRSICNVYEVELG